MATTDPVTSEARRFSIRLPRPLWIGLATFLIVVVAAVGLRVGMPIYRQQAAINGIERAGGNVTTRHGGPDWLRVLLGDEQMKFFDEVVDVRLNDTLATDFMLDEVGVLTNLRQLSTGNSTDVTDAGVAHLKRLTRLQYLFLGNPTVTDSGIGHLTGLTNLQDLRLPNTQTTDAGVAHLIGLTKLEWLSLSNTRVTGSGFSDLKSLGLKGLWLDNTPVTDVGLAHLKALTSLEMLSLGNSRVSDEGLAHLTRLTELKELSLHHTQVTDSGVIYLIGLKNLRILRLYGTPVTDHAIQTLKNKLPDCEIRH